MTADLVAQGIRSREITQLPNGDIRHESVAFGVADPSIFIRDGGPSIAETMSAAGLSWRRADNKRTPGWAEVRRRLNGEGGSPLLYLLDCCDDTIRTLPTLQVDDKDPEDLDTEGEDHAADETRYACMGRPWTEYAPVKETLSFPKLPNEMTIDELIARKRSQRILAEQDSV